MAKRSDDVALDKGIECTNVVGVREEVTPTHVNRGRLEFADRNVCEREKSKPSNGIWPICSAPDKTSTRCPRLAASRRGTQQEFKVVGEDGLARSEEMLPHMLLAFKALHPAKGATLETDLAALGSADEKATKFLEVFRDTRVSKGRFAQELADLLDNSALSTAAVPTYIRNALEHLGVVVRDPPDEHD